VVATVQGLDYERAKWGGFASNFLRMCALAAGAFPEETIVVSQKLQRHYREKYGRNTTYVPNTITILPEKPLPADNRFGLVPGKYVLFLGRIVPEKGVHYLIEAFRGIETDYHLAICGGAHHMEDYMEELRSKAGEDPRIHFVGPVFGEDKENIFSSAAVYVHPSEIEGLPIALLEAMSHSRCVLVSDIEENVETVGADPVCGRLFRSGDVKSLQTELAYLLAQPEERDLLGKMARERVAKEYSWDGIADKVEAVYRRVCS
jgi:glycosyltransferase involved in cell wall biosynthesis